MLVSIVLNYQLLVCCSFEDKMSSLVAIKVFLFSVFYNFTIMLHIGLVVVTKFQRVFLVFPITKGDSFPFSPWIGQFLPSLPYMEGRHFCLT